MSHHHGPSPADVSRGWLEPTSKGLSDILVLLTGRGCEGGHPPHTFHIFLENGQERKICTVRDHFTTAQGLDGAALGADTARRAQALPAPWREVHGEVGHTPLGGVPVLREEEKDTDVAVRDVLLALLIEALCINRERIQQRSEMVFLSRKLNI